MVAVRFKLLEELRAVIARTKQLPPLAEDRFQPAMPLVTAATIGLNLLALNIPIVMLIIFDRILPNQAFGTLTLLVLGAVVAFTLEALLRTARTHIMAWSAAKFEHITSEDVASRLLAMPLNSFESAGAGRHLERFKNVGLLKQHYAGQSFQQWLDLPFSLLYLLIIALVAWPVAILLLVGYGIFGHLSLKFSEMQRDPQHQRLESDQRRSNFLIETLSNIHTLKSMSMEALMLRRYDRLQESSARAVERMAYVVDSTSNHAALFGPLISMLVAALGAVLVVTGQISSGELSVCIFLSLRALSPLQRIGSLWVRSESDAKLASELGQLLEQPGLATADPSEQVSADSDIVVCLQDVDFGYPGSDTPLFDGLNLTIKRGETVFIRGENGCGRTTLLGMIAGFIEPAKGHVQINGADLSTIDKEQLSRIVGYLPQRVVMFNGTLLQNVTMFREDLAEQAQAVARDLGLEDFILALPQGWETRVGDAASEAFPPGLRQRVGIIRALASRPQIILFDDATAAVDAEGETLILQYLEKLKGEATLILVTQRPSLQRLADRAVDLRLSKAHPIEGSFIQGFVASQNVQHTAEVMAERLSHLSVETDGLMDDGYWKRLDDAVISAFKRDNDLSRVVAPLLKVMGWRGPIRDVIESFPYFAQELDITGLVNGLGKLGYRVSEVSGEISEIDDRAYPCLVIPDEGQAMVLLDRGAGGYVGQYALNGERVQLSHIGHGKSLFFQRTEEELETHHNWTSETLFRLRPLLIQAAAVSALLALLMLTSSLFTMVVYNTVMPSRALDTLFYLMIGVVIALIFAYFTIQQRAQLFAFIAGRIEYLFGTAAMEKLMQLSPSYTERSAVGAQIARLGSFEAIRDLFTSSIAASVLELPATIIVAGILIAINPVAFPVIASVVVIYLVLYLFLEPLVRERVSALGRLTTRRNEFLVEMVTKMRGIRESRIEQVWLERYRQLSADSVLAGYRVEQFTSVLAGAAYLIMMVAGLCLVAFSVPLALEGKIGSGVLIASLILIWRVLGPLQSLLNNLSRIERVRSAATQFDTLINLKGERLDQSLRVSSRNVEGQIEFSRVSFRYSMAADPALIGVSLNVPAGGMIAVTGQNGSGKSTLLKLLLGMYTPQAGTIRLDGVDIRQMDPVMLRRLMGYVPQEMQFFRATLAQNLRFAQPDATDAEVVEALQIAGAYDQVLQLPRGLEYRIGDSSSDQLPASLRYKLTLARAYLTRAQILLFDEPGTGLDQDSDACFMAALQALRGKRTVVFISHRPSHIKLADSVLLFRGGYLQGTATPDELFRRQA